MYIHISILLKIIKAKRSKNIFFRLDFVIRICNGDHKRQIKS